MIHAILHRSCSSLFHPQVNAIWYLCSCVVVLYALQFCCSPTVPVVLVYPPTTPTKHGQTQNPVIWREIKGENTALQRATRQQQGRQKNAPILQHFPRQTRQLAVRATPSHSPATEEHLFLSISTIPATCSLTTATFVNPHSPCSALPRLH